MKKRYRMITVLAVAGLLMTGCGSNSRLVSEADQNSIRVSQGSDRMEALAPKTSVVTSATTGTDQKASLQPENLQTADASAKSTAVAASDGSSGAQTGNTAAQITGEQAKKIAFDDACVNETDVTCLSVEHDGEEQGACHRVEFCVGDQIYEYEIDDQSGTIQSRSCVTNHDGNHSHHSGTESSGHHSEHGEDGSGHHGVSLISRDAAAKVALDRVSGATQEHLEMELEEDDGCWKYEGEIHHNGKCYEFELNAENGGILEWKEEND